MAAILAIWNRTGGPVEPDIVDAMLAASRHRAVDGQNVQYHGSVALAHQHFTITPQDLGENQPLIDSEAGLVITCDARLDDRDTLADKLAVDKPDDVSDGQLVLRSFKRWGPGCVDHLLGDFAFVLWDPKERRLFIARDALGARDLCFFENDRVFIAASEIRQLLAYPSIPRKINERKVADYLLVDWSDQDNTFYENIWYWPPAHCGYVTHKARDMRRYWSLDPEKRIEHRDAREYAHEYRELMERAVRDRQRVHGPIALSLSGGPDSASLAALMSERANGGRPLCISYVFDEYPDCDERKFIQPVLDHFGLESVFIKGDSLWPLSDLDTWPVFEDFASQDPYVRLPMKVIDSAAERGCRVVMNGHYSDVLMAGGKYWAFEMLMTGRISELVKGLSEAPARGKEVSQLIRYVLSAWLPRSLKSMWHRGIPGGAREHYSVLNKKFVSRLGLLEGEQKVMEGGIRSGRIQLQKAAHLLSAMEPQGQAAFRWLSNARGVEYLDPFFDRRLIEYVMQVPAHLLGRPPIAKRLLRESMENSLTEKVLWRRDKTSLVSFFTAGLAGPGRETVRQLFANSEVLRTGYIAEPWISRFITEMPLELQIKGNSYLLWLVLCLELWLRRFWRG